MTDFTRDLKWFFSHDNAWGVLWRLVVLSFTIFAPTGYYLDICRRATKFGPNEVDLPDPFEKFTDYWLEGLKLACISFVFCLPLIAIIIFCAWKNIPFVGNIAQLIILPVTPMLYIYFTVKSEQDSLFDIGKMISIASEDLGWFIGWVFLWCIWNGIGSMGILLLLFGVMFTSQYAMVSYCYALGSNIYGKKDYFKQMGFFN
ncbi:DUF4013 domain-containing protein [bacterium]|nr:DUF4013 domain-containing protein [bacterium]